MGGVQWATGFSAVNARKSASRMNAPSAVATPAGASALILRRRALIASGLRDSSFIKAAEHWDQVARQRVQRRKRAAA